MRGLNEMMSLLLMPGWLLLFTCYFTQVASGFSLTEVVLGSSSSPSQNPFLQKLDNAIFLPALGVCPGSISKPDTPIFVCSSNHHQSIYDTTISDRRCDLVFVGARGPFKGTTTVVLDNDVPTYIGDGKHAEYLQQLLKDTQIISQSQLEELVQVVTSAEGSEARTIVDLRNTAGLAVCGRTTQASPSKRVVIVGAGILGSSIALNLARKADLDITVVDGSADMSDVGATTRASWAWLNANRKRPESYQQLNVLGMHWWRKDPVLKDLPSWTGSLVRYHDKLDDSALTADGYYTKAEGPLTESEWQKLEADANFSGGYVYSCPNEGLVDPIDAVKVLRQSATGMGVEFLYNHKVSGLLVENEKVVGVECLHDETHMTLAADCVVVAAGTGSAAAVLGGLPMLHSPGCLAFAQPASSGSQQLNRLLVDTVDKCHVLQRRDASIVVGGGKLEIGGSPSASTLITSAKENQQTDDADEHLAGARQLAPGALRDAKLTHTSQAIRPIPNDGLPSLGYLQPGLYSAVSHSGVTLAPLLGSLVATEIAQNIELDLLKPFRPDRLFVE